VSQYSGIPGPPWTKSKTGLPGLSPWMNIPCIAPFNRTRIFLVVLPWSGIDP
jgi:hypothetical protein